MHVYSVNLFMVVIIIIFAHAITSRMPSIVGDRERANYADVHGQKIF